MKSAPPSKSSAAARAALFDRPCVQIEAAIVSRRLFLGPVLNPATADEEPWTWNLALCDAVAGRDRGLQLASGIARRRHPVGEQLGGGPLHHLGVVGAHHVVPRRVVPVAEDVEMHVQIDQPRHHGVAIGVDDLGARRHGEPALIAHRDDAVAVDEHDGVLARRPAKAIDQIPADNRERRLDRGGRRLRHLTGGAGRGKSNGYGGDGLTRSGVSMRVGHRHRCAEVGAGRAGWPGPPLTTTPSLTTTSTSASAMMLNSGSPLTTMMSASLPGSTVPRSRPRPMMLALMRVAAEMARCGDIPISTWALISRQSRLGVEVHRCARIGAHAHDGTRFDELLQASFTEPLRAVGPGEVSEAVPVLERALNLFPDVRREVLLQLRILEPLWKLNRRRDRPTRDAPR